MKSSLAFAALVAVLSVVSAQDLPVLLEHQQCRAALPTLFDCVDDASAHNNGIKDTQIEQCCQLMNQFLASLCLCPDCQGKGPEGQAGRMMETVNDLGLNIMVTTCEGFPSKFVGARLTDAEGLAGFLAAAAEFTTPITTASSASSASAAVPAVGPSRRFSAIEADAFDADDFDMRTIIASATAGDAMVPHPAADATNPADASIPTTANPATVGEVEAVHQELAQAKAKAEAFDILNRAVAAAEQQQEGSSSNIALSQAKAEATARAFDIMNSAVAAAEQQQQQEQQQGSGSSAFVKVEGNAARQDAVEALQDVIGSVAASIGGGGVVVAVVPQQQDGASSEQQQQDLTLEVEYNVTGDSMAQVVDNIKRVMGMVQGAIGGDLDNDSAASSAAMQGADGLVVDVAVELTDDVTGRTSKASSVMGSSDDWTRVVANSLQQQQQQGSAAVRAVPVPAKRQGGQGGEEEDYLISSSTDSSEVEVELEADVPGSLAEAGSGTAGLLELLAQQLARPVADAGAQVSAWLQQAAQPLLLTTRQQGTQQEEEQQQGEQEKTREFVALDPSWRFEQWPQLEEYVGDDGNAFDVDESTQAARRQTAEYEGETGSSMTMEGDLEVELQQQTLSNAAVDRLLATAVEQQQLQQQQVLFMASGGAAKEETALASGIMSWLMEHYWDVLMLMSAVNLVGVVAMAVRLWHLESRQQQQQLQGDLESLTPMTQHEVSNPMLGQIFSAGDATGADAASRVPLLSAQHRTGGC